MNKSFVLIFLAFSFFNFTLAQQKKISLEELWSGAFLSEGMEAIYPLKNGQQYTVLNNNGTAGTVSIDIYNYNTSEKLETVVSSLDLPSKTAFSSYTFSRDESKILLATEEFPIYRRSKMAIYYIYDVVSKKITQIADTWIQEPTFSPDGKRVVFVNNNNMYLYTIADGTIIKMTSDGERNKIINGITDWVYEEEFKFVRAFEWNSDGTKIAFLRFDETAVPEFAMDVYGTDLYPFQYIFKYPKAGENNSLVTLHLYDVASGKITQILLPESYYIPRITQMNNPNYISIQTINRHQNHLKLYTINTQSNEVSLLHEETDDAYVDITDDLTFLADDSFIWTSENDGYKHIYLHSKRGDLIKQISKGDWEVTKYYGYDQKNDRIYYQSTENGSVNRDIYSIGIKGKNKKRLSSKEGTNSAEFSADFTYFINEFSSGTEPPEFTLHKAANGDKIKEILNNNDLLVKLGEYEISPREFSTLSINGNELNMWMVKPKDFDPSKKYPLLMFQYSGPGSQRVANTWMNTRDYWHQILASQGYIIVCVDGRGTGFKGRDFKKVTYLNLVKYETEDQIAAAKKLSEYPFIDPDRTGIWGWSYGGHMSTNCLLKGNDTFEMAIAVAPVTSWRFYDSIYTERFMRTPAENPEGYDENSPFNYPELLKGNYLLIHGSGDDNVHVQNSMRMIEALVQANKQFDWAIYPDKDHGITGGNTSLHLYTKMTNFIKNNL
jgi:dipeptidyl-peptidase-4